MGPGHLRIAREQRWILRHVGRPLVRIRILQQMQRLPELIKSKAALRRVDRVEARDVGTRDIAARHHRALRRRSRSLTCARVASAGDFLRQFRIAAQAGVIEQQRNELHVARLDTLVAERNRVGLTRLESGLQRQELGQPEMDVALVRRYRTDATGAADRRLDDRIDQPANRGSHRRRTESRCRHGLAASSSSPGGGLP